MLEERIKKNIDYFRGIDVTDGLYIVKVKYKERWGAFPSKDGKIKVAKSENVQDEWFYYAETEDNDIEVIFDLIEETIEMNSSVTAKIELLTEKIEELKNIFSETPLQKLQTLKFVMEEKKTKRKYTKKKKEEEIQNNEINKNVETNG